jgi:DHA1 family bicyclomycin/chloramphenicol resistance-like MFS transporter
LNEHQFAWLFMSGVVGMMVGAFLSGRLGGRISPERAVGLGYAIMFAAALYSTMRSTT